MFAASLHLSCELDDKADYDIWGQSAQGLGRMQRHHSFDAEGQGVWWLRQFEEGLKKEVIAQITQEKFEASKERYEKEGRTAKY
ncbi:hypothetical protein D6D25_09167 [Aureobasidium pullulans]|nr:hypothetical protein D6D25_09167 [Aureobasidium pullulans]